VSFKSGVSIRSSLSTTTGFRSPDFIISPAALTSSYIKSTGIYRDVRFDIAASRSNEILEMVENREVNIGFVRGDFISSLEQILVSTDQTHVVSRNAIKLSDLPHIPQIDFARSLLL
jgi:DNA-binding transcriptional LysR family regulator